MNKGIVLIYHRVIDLDSDPHRLAVSPVNFLEQMRFLKSRFKIIPLHKLSEKLKDKYSMSNCVSITFDDGYADNLHYAFPVIEELKIPVTFFVTVGMVGKQNEFWWDELEYLFYAVKERFLPLEIRIDQKKYFWKLSDPSEIELVYREIHKKLKFITFSERERIMTKLFKWRRVDRRHGREMNRVLNKKELRQIALSSNVTIGSHTITHPTLKYENRIRSVREISRSKYKIERIIKKKISGFSYPFGQKSDYDEKTTEIVKNAGYSFAVTNIQENVCSDTNQFLIPRRLIRNWELSEFRENIDVFFSK